MGRFIEGEDRHQATLFPELLDDYIAEDSPVPPLVIGFHPQIPSLPKAPFPFSNILPPLPLPFTS